MKADIELGTRPGTARACAASGGFRRRAGLVFAAGLVCGLAAAAWGQDADIPTVPEVQPEEQPAGEEMIAFSAFSEPVELMTLVDFIASELNINISTKGTVTGQVMFNAEQEIPRSELLDLLEAMLAQYNYSLTRDPVGFYMIQPATDITLSFNGEFATTKIIPTPNIKPSSLKTVVDAAVAGEANRIAYVDDLGVIVATGSPRQVRAVEELVTRLIGEYRRTTFTIFELSYVAAQAARERAVALVGQGATLRAQFPGQDQVAQIPGQASSIDNLADRLTIDPSGNALLFRGTEEEIAQVAAVMELIDRPTTLLPREYTAGANAASIANIASQRGLGEVIQLEDTQEQQFQFPNFGRGNQPTQQQQTTLGGGSVMMVDAVRGTILYYGTEQQQAQLAALIDALDVELEEIVIERYAVKNIDAVELAELLQGIIEGATQNDSPLLPGARGNQTGNQGAAFQRFFQTGEMAENAFVPTAEDSFVTAHEATNVVIVKAPAKLQSQFARIIGELDVRRPQVYLDVNILAVSDSRDFRLAVEGQINAGQFFTQTNFGLGDPGELYTDPKLPLPGLGGYSASLIKSQYVPFILNAIQSDTDARILSSPQLLVNDNQEASIESIEEQPTTTTTFGSTTDQTSFAGYEEAGTQLVVTPSISEAGYLRLQYEIELSNFTGAATGDGIPPPKATRRVGSESVTIPTDATIVVGGIKVDDTRESVVKVPILGDIPIAGLLFRDTNRVTSAQVLYIFITPRILNDRNFADLRLLSRGPQEFAGLEPDLPVFEPAVIELIDPAAALAGGRTPPPAPQSPGGVPAERMPDDEPVIIPLFETQERDDGVVRRSGEGR